MAYTIQPISDMDVARIASALDRLLIQARPENVGWQVQDDNSVARAIASPALRAKLQKALGALEEAQAMITVNRRAFVIEREARM